ncbi:MAG: alkaline phytoceramidase [Alphaproteobacteria bacterium]|nr:alkaline phytoceramidase [Alphaproteobacteria bacterium]
MRPETDGPNYARNVSILSAIGIAAFIGLLQVSPIPQDPTFHLFADVRTCLGIVNFGNTVSNAAFALVGLWGLWTILGPTGQSIFPRSLEKWPYIVFFSGVALVSVGSAYYHGAPDNDRLFWDRLPMTMAFMGFFTAFLTDRINRPNIIPWLLPLLVTLGAASLIYWSITEAQGTGDLRFYGFVQFFPIALLPIVLILFPNGRYTKASYLLWVIAWYGSAMALEKLDHWLYSVLQGALSGHTLKHLFAAVAAFIVIQMLRATNTHHVP